MSFANAYEQYMLELVNQQRALVGAQPLAFNSLLNDSSEQHTQWMVNTDTFDHTGSGGSSPTQRMQAAGYQLTGSWGTAENIAWRGIANPAGFQDEIDGLHNQFWNSAGHKANMLNANYREVGIGFETGDFAGTNAGMVTQNFAYSGTGSFLTGVAFDDQDGDQFYDVGEGLGGVTVTVRGANGAVFTTTTSAAGGYSLKLAAGTYTVEFDSAAIAFSSKQVTIGSQNVKVDLVDPLMDAAGQIAQDLGGDGKADVLWRADNGNVAVWHMNGNGVGQTSSLGAVANTWQVADIGDFNGDSKADVLWLNENGNVAIWQMNGGVVQQSISLGNVGTTWNIAAAGDFNGDGKDDILWRNDNGNVATWQMSVGTVQQTASQGYVANGWNIAGTGDFNADGKDDILWQKNSGEIAIWHMNGGSVQNSASLGSVGAGWNIKGAGDFNGDGKDDILWQHNDGTLAIWQMNGASVAQSQSLGSVGTVWDVADIADYSGDGQADIMFRHDNGTVAMWEMNGTTVGSSIGLGGVGLEWHIV